MKMKLYWDDCIQNDDGFEAFDDESKYFGYM